MRKYIFALLILILASPLFSGCKTLTKRTAALTIASGAQEQERQNYDITVAVVPFIEKRLGYNRYGSVYRYLVPMALYGTIRYERPEEAKMFNCPEEARMFSTRDESRFNMSENLAKVVASDLEKRKIFGKVIFAPNLENADTDLILSADINSTLYEGKTYSYGISFLGPVLWCFGLPAGSSYNKLNLTFHLKKRDTKELIWAYVLNKERSVVQGLYYNRAENVNNYDNLLKEGMDKFTLDLKRKLAKIPLEQLRVSTPAVSPQAQAEQAGLAQAQRKEQPTSTAISGQQSLSPVQKEETSPQVKEGPLPESTPK